MGADACGGFTVYSDVRDVGRPAGLQGMNGFPNQSILKTLIGMIALMWLTGCALSEPRTRLGGLPCPGPLTLFELADPEHLGTHRYGNLPHLFGSDECGHGILYTRRAGFLDMAHVRESMDWSRYVFIRVGRALRDHSTTLNLDGYDNCPFRLLFHYPIDWDVMAPDRRERIINELSLRIAHRVALDALTWHEIITWFGYGTTVVWSEKASAFTYEDTMSHVIGMLAADDALRHPAVSWNRDATRALGEELVRVGVVSKEEAERAVELVKGKWWADGQCIRRMLDVGLAGDRIHPWLVRGIPGGDEPPQAFALPTLRDVEGRDFAGFWSMTIEPSWLIPAPVCACCEGKPRYIDPAIHFPVLMEKIRKEVKAELGPTADQAYDE